MMTRRDYIAVAAILFEYRSSIPTEEYANLCNDFADYMEEDNDKFQDLKFLRACGVESVDILFQPKPASEHLSLA
jgi:hypothetical protein